MSDFVVILLSSGKDLPVRYSQGKGPSCAVRGVEA